ncbi:MAG: SOS response-associated peptidase [Chloroflexota bacterium]
MCGRFTLRAPSDAIAALFDLPEEPMIADRYNIAPTQPVAVVRMNPGTGKREWTHALWGLIPSWSKDPKMGARLINARSETVREKPSFRAAFKRRRCLVPMDGFYEWKKVGKIKQPYHITLQPPEQSGESLFAIAGLWERWSSPDGSQLESCTLLTTEANEAMSSLHHRMPVIVEPEDYAMWLGSGADDDPYYLDQLQHLMRPYGRETLSIRPVSTYVNNARNEGAECLAEVSE